MSYNQHKWFEFIEEARVALLQGNSLEYKRTIQLLVEPSFHKWHYLPGEWTDLQKLADMVLELNQKL